MFLNPRMGFAAIISNCRKTTANPLARRFILSIIALSSALSLFISTFEVYYTYKHDVKMLEASHSELAIVVQDTIADTLWKLDSRANQITANGMVRLAHIDRVEIVPVDQEPVVAGKTPTGSLSRSEWDLSVKFLNKTHRIGSLKLYSSHKAIFESLTDQFVRLLLLNFAKTLIVSIFGFVLFHLLVSRHLSCLSTHLRQFSPNHEFQALDLKRRDRQNDDLTRLEISVNEVCSDLASKYELIRENNIVLEDQVALRTRMLEESHIQLLEHERMAVIGRLSSTISHELGNPLGSIVADLFLLQLYHDPSIGNIGVTLARMQRSVDRCDVLMEKLRKLSDDLFALGNNANTLLSSEQVRYRLYESCPVTIEFSFFDTDQYPHVFSKHSAVIYVILQALVENAVQACEETGEGGVVEVAYFQTMLNRTFEVIDNGTGVSEGDSSKLFDPLFSGRIYGLGLGLSFAKTMATSIDGTLELKSDEHKTVATLTLPLINNPFSL